MQTISIVFDHQHGHSEKHQLKGSVWLDRNFFNKIINTECARTTSVEHGAREGREGENKPPSSRMPRVRAAQTPWRSSTHKVSVVTWSQWEEKGSNVQNILQILLEIRVLQNHAKLGEGCTAGRSFRLL